LDLLDDTYGNERCFAGLPIALIMTSPVSPDQHVQLNSKQKKGQPVTPSEKSLSSLAIDAHIAFNKLYENSSTVAAMMRADELAELNMPDAGIIDCKLSNKRLMLVTNHAEPGRVKLVVANLATEEHMVEKDTTMEAITANDVFEAMQKHFVH